MPNTKNANAVAMLMSAISSAATHNDRDRQVALANAGMEWANAATDAAERAAWEKIEIAAEWRGGFSAE